MQTNATTERFPRPIRPRVTTHHKRATITDRRRSVIAHATAAERAGVAL